MRVVISGSSGMIGARLVDELRSDGHEVVRLVRREVQNEDEVSWRPERGEIDPAVLAGAGAVVNLSGKNIGEARWTEGVKHELRASRVDLTRLLATAMAAADPPPAVLVNASATGIYGNRGDDPLDEKDPPAADFLAQLVGDWEAAALAARSDLTRVALLRFGMVIGKDGALGRMLPIFKLGLGGPLGSGRQWWPWIALDDAVGAIRSALTHPEAFGAINVVSPEQVQCRDFVKTLGRVLHRPAFLPAHPVALRLVAGEMADALLLASARVQPTGLERLGYAFRVPELEEAIRRGLSNRT